jgi:tetratricopeptide (TPR) repeat protein
LNNLSLCLNQLGEPEQALSPNEKAISIRRDLIQNIPKQSLGVGEAQSRGDLMRAHVELFFGLGATLSNRSISLLALERSEEALAAAEESTQIFRDGLEEAPDFFLPSLANALNNESNCLAALGRPDEALAAVEEANRALRLLVVVRPRAYLPILADSLQNQSARMHELGRRDQAVAAMSEATFIRYILLQGAPSLLSSTSPPPGNLGI